MSSFILGMREYRQGTVLEVKKDGVWTASGGDIPPSGSGAKHADLTTDEATVANRRVWAYWPLSTTRTTANKQQLRLKDAKVRLQKPD